MLRTLRTVVPIAALLALGASAIPTLGSPPEASRAPASTSTPPRRPLSRSLADAFRRVLSPRAHSASAFTFSVAVSPDAGTATRLASEQASDVFVVRNSGTSAATFTLQASCTGTKLSSCVASRPSVSLAAGDSTSVAVSYLYEDGGGGGLGSGPTVFLKAWKSDNTAVRDSGSVTVSTGSPISPTSTLRLDRDECVVAAAGAGTFECGDLRLVHTLPATRVLGTSRPPALVYNSQHARPYPIVPFTFTLMETGSPFVNVSEVQATLKMGGSTVAARNWSVSIETVWPTDVPAPVYRFGIGFDASALATGVHGYTLEVIATYTNTQVDTVTTTGELVVVNRSASPFGAGWWVAGVESLYFPSDTTTRLWVGGDGSYRVYHKVAANTWVPDSWDRPDTLRYQADSLQYVRTLPGRVEIRFDAVGHHVRTRNKAGHWSTFEWSGSNLTRIYMPRTASFNTGYSYLFEYNNTGSKLSRVVAPGSGREVTFAMSSGRITSITGPDTTSVGLAYTGSSVIPASRTDRRGISSTFTFDNGSRLSRVTNTMGTVGTSDDISVGFSAAESAPLFEPMLADSVYTEIDGPRPDADALDKTRFYVNASGVPTQIRNALGYNTLLTRSDARWPGLVTQIRTPYGRTSVEGFRLMTAAYDARGNMVSSTDWSTQATHGRPTITLYSWDPAWDAVTEITAPEGEVTRFAYDATTGRRLWEQRGPSSARRVSYGYYATSDTRAPGLLQSVTIPATHANPAATTTYEFDAHGNVRTQRSPLGFYTLTYSDAIGRDTLVVTPIDTDSATDSTRVKLRGVKQRSVFDVMDRVVETATLAPAYNSVAATTLSVRTRYDAGGLVRSVTRRSDPDINSIDSVMTEFRYDAAGRKTVEIAPPGYWADTTFYDLAGNVTAMHTRRGGVINFTYDRMNRQVRRASGDDTARFVFDVQGNLTSATNKDARITRTYFVNGLLKTDSTRIRTSTPTSVDSLWTGYTTHRYGLAYEYDLNGRRTRLTYPSNLMTGSGISGLRDHADYGYDPATGALAWVEGLGSDTRFDYRYDAAGLPDSTYMPAGIKEAYTYDVDGRLTQRVTSAPSGGSWFTGGNLRNDAYSYDARGKMGAYASVIGPAGIQHNAPQGNLYDGIGNLIGVAHTYDSPYSTEAWHIDALGNRTDVVRTGAGVPAAVTYASQYEAHSGVLQRTISQGDTSAVADTTTYYYNLGGDNTGVVEHGKRIENPLFGSNPTEPEYHQRIVENSSYFNSEGQLYDHRRLTNQENGAGLRIRESYSYDALGRRVWRRAYNGWDSGTLTQRDTMCQRPQPPSDCQSFVERTVWDGDQIVVEIRASSEPGASAIDTERDTAFGHSLYYGRVAYVHAGGIDQPVELVRMDTEEPFAAVPHANWRGTYDVLTPTATRYSECGPQIGYPLGSGAECFPFDFASVSAYAEVTPRNHDGSSTGPRSWAGSLISESRDESGLLYRRNRYYDPATGRFTQEDPIGLAGGLNSYGFAAGDPITYADPFGLCPEFVDGVPCTLQDVADIAAGFGDGASYNLTAQIREATTEGGDRVNRQSPLYEVAHAAGKMAEIVASLGSSEGIEAAEASSGARTEPTLPSRTIVKQDGVTIFHNYRSVDHGYAHAHVEGQGPTTRIGQNGRPYRNDPELSPQQRRVVEDNRSTIRRAIGKIGRWLDYHLTH